MYHFPAVHSGKRVALRCNDRSVRGSAHFDVTSVLACNVAFEDLLNMCRQCSSGLQAIATVAASIKAGYYTVGLAGGVETMSTNPMTWEGGVNPAIEKSKQAQSCMLPMGITSENVAAKFGLSRCSTGAYSLLYCAMQCAACTLKLLQMGAARRRHPQCALF